MKVAIRRLPFVRRFGERGVAALEFAFVLPVLLLIAFGLIDFGRLIWVHTTLDYAVQAAARCGAISPTLCKAADGTVSVTGYAAHQAYALPVLASNFTVNTAATCASGVSGVAVTGRVTFHYFLAELAGHTASVTASACYPI